MASIVVPGGGLWIPPGMTMHRTVVPSINNFASIADADDKLAYIFRAPKTGTLEQFEFLIATITTFPATGIRMSFQDVDATTGAPDGGVDQFAVVATTPGSNAWVSPPNALTHDGSGGGTKRSVTRGDLIAAVIDINPVFSTGSFQSYFITNTETNGPQLFPYCLYFTTAWAKQGSMYPILAIKYDDGKYYPIGPQILPVTATGTTNTYNVDSAGTDEIALRFKVPFEATLAGGFVNLLLAGNTDIVLYDDLDQVVASVSLDKDIVQDSATGKRFTFEFPTPVTLAINKVYRLSVKPTTTTNISMYHIVAASNARLGAMPAGVEFYKSTRVNGGTWADVDNHVPVIGLQFSEITGGNVPIVITASDGLR
jgi:hypothetical protein